MGAEPDAERTILLERWLELTRRVLPAMAAAQGWPIREDHCFMRVCLDAVAGAPWRQVIRPPAIRHMSEAQLAAAVRVAQDIADRPDTLAALNSQSLRQRRAAALETRRRAAGPNRDCTG